MAKRKSSNPSKGEAKKRAKAEKGSGFLRGVTAKLRKDARERKRAAVNAKAKKTASSDRAAQARSRTKKRDF